MLVTSLVIWALNVWKFVLSMYVYHLVLLSMPALTCAASGTEVINCSWTKPAAEIVNNYLLTWNYLGPCNPDSQSFLQQGSDRELELTNLEEGGNYEISLMAINSLQRGPAAKVSVSTSMASEFNFALSPVGLFETTLQ